MSEDTITLSGSLNTVTFKKVRRPGKAGTRLEVVATKYPLGERIKTTTLVCLDHDQRELLKKFLED